MQMFELMASSQSHIHKDSVRSRSNSWRKNFQSTLNRSKSVNEHVVSEKPPKIARSKTFSNVAFSEMNEIKFDNKLPSSFFKPKNIYPDIDDLIDTLNKLKHKELKNSEPSMPPWQHSTFKNNPLHCTSSEFEDYDDRIKIENYQTYGELNKNFFNKPQLNNNHLIQQTSTKTKRIRPKPRHKKYKKSRRVKKRRTKRKYKQKRTKKSIKVKTVNCERREERSENVNQNRNIFSCCFDPGPLNKDYYLVIPESEIETIRPKVLKEQNIYIIQPALDSKKSLKLHKKRKPLQDLFDNDISRITNVKTSSIAPKPVPVSAPIPIVHVAQSDDFTNVSSFKMTDTESEMTVIKQLYKLYTSETINFIDDKTYMITGHKSLGSSSTKRIRKFFLNTSPEYDNNPDFLTQLLGFGSTFGSLKSNFGSKSYSRSLSNLSAMRENIKLLKIRYKDRETNAVLTEKTVKYPDSYRTKHRIKPKGLIHRYEERIQDGNQNVLKMHQAPNGIRDNPAIKKPPLETKHPCHRSKTMAPISRPISNNFALINSNLNEIENLLKNPKSSQEINLDLKKGLHDWSLWRAKFNETLIKSCFTPAKLKKSIQTHNDLRLKSQSYIEPSFVHYSSYYGEDTNLDPESFMFYGLPRIRIAPRATLAEEESDQTIDTSDSIKFKKKSGNIVTGVSVKEKIKVFENSDHKNSITRKFSAPDQNDFIETKHIYRHEPDNKLTMMAMPCQETKEVLKAADGDIIFTKAVQKVEDSPEKVNCLGKSKHKISEEEKKQKNYFMPLKNILLPKTDTIKAAAVAAVQAAFPETKPKKSGQVTGTVRRRKKENKSRKAMTEKPKSNRKRKQQSTRTRTRKSRNFNIFNPGNYQTYPTRKSPFFITNNTAQNIEYFTNHILESTIETEKIDHDIIDLFSSSSSSLLTLESAESNSKHKSKTVRDRTKRHFDRKQRQKSQVKTSFIDNFQNLHRSKHIKTKQSINSRESLPPPPPVPPPPPPEIENIPKRRSSDVSKLSIPMVQPPPPQVPPPSLSRYLESEGFNSETIVALTRESASGKKIGLRRMKVTEEKIDLDSFEIIEQDDEPKLKSSIEKEHSNLFKLPKLRYQPNSQLDSSMVSTTTLSNARSRPKTSKEILQEISRLTNGTTPNRFNSTFHNNSSDLDSTIMSSNSKFLRK